LSEIRNPQSAIAITPDFLIILCNFTPVPRPGYRVGVPVPGDYGERLNSDATCYGGSGVVNAAPIQAEPVPWHGQRWSIVVTLPPLATLILKRLPE
jgi:1,4-alpha-glucan branching enzyme